MLELPELWELANVVDAKVDDGRKRNLIKASIHWDSIFSVTAFQIRKTVTRVDKGGNATRELFPGKRREEMRNVVLQAKTMFPLFPCSQTDRLCDAVSPGHKCFMH